MAGDFSPLKLPGKIRAMATDDVALVQGVKALAGDLTFEDPISGQVTLAAILAFGGGNVSAPGGETAGRLAQFTGPFAIGQTTITAASVSGHIADQTAHTGLLDLAGLRPMTGDLNVDGNDIDGGIVLGGTLVNVGVFGYLDEIGAVGFFGDPTNLIAVNGINFDVVTGVGSFHTGATPQSPLGIGDWPAALALAIPLNSIRYVGVEWNGAVPQVVVKTTDTWTNIQEWRIGFVTRDATGVHVTPAPTRLTNFASLMQQRLSDVEPFARANGLNITTNLLNVLRSSGRGWLTTTPIDYALFDSSAAGTFTRYYRDGGSGFTEELAQTEFENDKYDDNSGTLVSLSNGRYGVRWWYMDLQSGGLSMVYGTSNATSEAAAQAEAQPGALPPRLQVGTIIIGQTVIRKGEASATSTRDVWTTEFTAPGGGTGDVNGPAGGVVANELTQFADTTGKVIEGSGVLVAAVELKTAKGAVSGYAGLDANLTVVQAANKLRTTSGPQILTLGAWTEGQALTRVGTTMVGAAIAGGTGPVEFRKRTTTVFSISTTPTFITFDEIDSQAAAHFSYSAGTFTALQDFECVVYAEGSMDWNSGTEPKVILDISKNTVEQGVVRANVYSSLMQRNSLHCMAYMTLATNDTVRVYWYTTIGGVNLTADTPKVAMFPRV